MSKKPAKTNAIREVEAAGIPFQFHSFQAEGAPSGVEVARILGEDEDRVFKTLVTQGKSGDHYVFMIPVTSELDLKKAAQAVGEKSISMLPSKELLPLTGYVHGGCSPVGMKHAFTTVIDETATIFEAILYSAGRIGCQLETSPDALAVLIGATYADLTA